MPHAPEVGSSPSTPPTTRLTSRALPAAVAVALLAVPFALTLLLVEHRWAPLLRADAGARDDLHAFAVTHGWFVHAMALVSDSGSGLTWLVVLAGVTLWLLMRGRVRIAVFVVVTAVGSSFLNSLVKTAVDRPRPVLADPVAHAGGASFPSGHAQSAMVGYAILLLLFLPLLRGAWRTAAVSLAVVMVVAIGFSRVALGVHYVSDVVAGFVLGAAWFAAMAAAFDVFSVDLSLARAGRHADVRRETGVQVPREAGRTTDDEQAP